GFLITYLLYAEKKETGKIAVKAFYLRRIFRIWPLYYFVFILGFLVLPHLGLFEVPSQLAYLEENYWINFIFYLIILPNLALAFSPEGISVPNIGQSWSIGVEEQFYLIWPLIVGFFKKPIHAILWVTGIYLLIKAGVVLYAASHQAGWLTVLKQFLAMSKIECMTIGGLGAYYYFFHREWILK
ncbi:MAG: acyltransferase, partial [Chitinophagaceae bacterium]|nr:acyltransferase [Chitinophagaceae bacterium]